MNADFAAPKDEALVKAARTDIVGVGTEPNPVRHLSLDETRQSATHSLALGGRGDEDLVELTDIGFEREKAGEPVSGIDANKHFPSGGQLHRYASAHRRFGGLLGDGETSRAPTLKPEPSNPVEIAVVIS